MMNHLVATRHSHSGCATRQELVLEGMKLLFKYDINSVFARENFIWAPNIAGPHTTDSLRRVVDAIKAARDKGVGKAGIEKALESLGKVAADLK